MITVIVGVVQLLIAIAEVIVIMWILRDKDDDDNNK